MSDVIINEQSLNDIADAIRLKLGVQTEYMPSEMAAAIESIEGGTYGTKEITENGTYDASDDGYTGYSQVTVDVAGGGGEETYLQFPNISINSNGYSYPLAIKDGIVSGFNNQYNFFRPLDDNGDLLDVDWSQPFEINVVFKLSAISDRALVLFGAEQGYFYAPSIEVNTNCTNVWCRFSTSGSTWDYSLSFSDVINGTLPVDTEINANAKWDGTDYTVTLIYGNNTFSKSITPSAAHYHSSSYNLEFGGIARSNGHYAINVSMDLTKCYIKSNDSFVWKADKSEVIGINVIRRSGYLSNGWYVTNSYHLYQDSTDPDCITEVFPVQANHTYVWCFGCTKNGNRGTLAFTTQDVLTNPVQDLTMTQLFRIDTADRVAYYSRTVFNITQDGYVVAYISNNQGGGKESYLLDITNIDSI